MVDTSSGIVDSIQIHRTVDKKIKREHSTVDICGHCFSRNTHSYFPKGTGN